MPRTRLDPSPNGPRLSAETADGRWVALDAAPDPIADAETRIAHAFEHTEPASIIVIGLGLGWVLDAIERRSPRTRVLALEPLADGLAAMRERRDWSAWLDTQRLRVLAGPGYDDAIDAFRQLDVREGDPPIIVHPVVAREFPAEVAAAREVAEAILSGARQNEEARRRFAGRYLTNTLTNIPAIAREADAARLQHLFAGLPAIVVGAGPSLDANLEGIRRVAPRAVVVAVDTAARPLAMAGLAPDLIVSVDPQAVNARHLDDLEGCDESWLVAEGSLDPGAFPAFAGRTFTFHVSNHHPWPWLREVGLDRGTLRAWGSVLTTAFDAAIHMGCDPIIFAGTDLAYTHERPYATHTNFDRDLAHLASPEEKAAAARAWIESRPHLEAADLHGRPTLTTPWLVQFRDWMVARSRDCGTRRVVNASGEGILHGGTIMQAGWDALDLPSDLPTRETWREKLREAWEADRAARHAAAQEFVARMGAPQVAWPVETWLDFGGEGVSADGLAALLDAAIAALE